MGPALEPPKHADHAKAVDKPIAGLLEDLARRGLLDDTIVWWGRRIRAHAVRGEERHRSRPQPGGFTVWVAGRRLRPGLQHGMTDEFGRKAIAGKVHMHDLHATILHQLGLNHGSVTFRYAGRDFRLTDVYGEVVREIVG